MANSGRPPRIKISTDADADLLDSAVSMGFTIEGLADQMQISPSYLHRIRKRNGKGFSRKNRQFVERCIGKEQQISLMLEPGKPLLIGAQESPLNLTVLERHETVWVVEISLAARSTESK